MKHFIGGFLCGIFIEIKFLLRNNDDGIELLISGIVGGLIAWLLIS